MRKSIRSVATAVALIALFAGSAAAPANQQSDDIRDRTNEHRLVHDAVAPLACSPSLDAIAQTWAQHMADNYAITRDGSKSLVHNPNLNAQAPSGWSMLGENIALNGGYAGPVEFLVNQWVTSPPHHLNLSNAQFTHVGVGYVLDSYGISWGVQDFGKYAGSPDPTLTTVMGTLVDASSHPLVGTAVVATTSGGTATGYVGTYGHFCMALPPGAGTITLKVNGNTIETLTGAAPGARLSPFIVAPDTFGAGAVGVVAQSPRRVLDTAATALDQPFCFTLRGRAGVPSNASGAILNVTVAQPSSSGNILVYADSDGTGATAAPRASTLNFEPGRDVANSAIVGLGPTGKICYAVRGSLPSRVIVDVSGYLTPEANVNLGNTTRVFDTRPAPDRVGSVAGPLGSGAVTSTRVAGSAVPAGATAVIANVTVTGVSGPGNLKVWAANLASPGTSVINFAPGQDKANAQIIGLSPSGDVNLESVASSTHAIVDVSGYLTPASLMVPVTPQRIVETRASSGIVGPIAGKLGADTIYGVSVGSAVPANATAIILNVTAVQPSSFGHLRVYPDTAGTGNTSPPDVSTLNYIPGRDIPNMVVVQLPADKIIQFYSAAASTDLVVDLVGYVLPAGM